MVPGRVANFTSSAQLAMEPTIHDEAAYRLISRRLLHFAPRDFADDRVTLLAPSRGLMREQKSKQGGAPQNSHGAPRD